MRRVLVLLGLFVAWPALADPPPGHEDAERRWAERNAALAAQWRVVAWGTERLPCVPVSEIVPGATNPDEALAVIQQGDPDAYLDKIVIADQWERIIRTQGNNLRMVRTWFDCARWRSVFGG